MFGERVHPRRRRRHEGVDAAEVAGGPNGARHRARRRADLCNNGGVLHAGRPSAACIVPGPFDQERYHRWADPARRRRAGRCTDLYTECDGRPLRAPNDLVFDATAASGSPTTASSTAQLAPATSARIYYGRCDGSDIQRGGLSRRRRRTASASARRRDACTAPRRSPDGSSDGVSSSPACSPTPVRSTRRRCLYSAPGLQLLDSLAVDGEGKVCVATLLQGGITCVSPDGESVEHIRHRRPDHHEHLLRRPGAAHGSTSRSRAPAGSSRSTGRDRAAARPTSNAGPVAGPSVASVPVRATLLRRDAGLPEEPGRLATSSSARCSPTGWRRPTTPTTPTWSWSTPARSSRTPARSRSTPSWRSTSAASRRRPAGRHRLHGRALRRRAGRGAARGRPGRRLRRARRPLGAHQRVDPGQRGAVPDARPAQPAAAAVDRAVGLREGRRGLRPQPAGSAPSRRSAARSAAATSASILAEVDAARGAARSCSSPRTWPRYGKDRPGELGAGSIVAARARPSAERVPTGSACSTSTRRDLTDALIDAICATGVPYFDLSLQHVSQAAAAAHAAVGRRRPLPAPHRRHPRARARRRVPLELHRRLPGRDRGRPRRAARLRRGGPARLVRLLRLLPRGRHLRRRPRRRRRPTPDGTSGSPSCASCRTRSPRRDATR